MTNQTTYQRTHREVSTWTTTDPTERGEAYIVVMRDLAEFRNDPLLRDHYSAELNNLIRPLGHMTAEDLNHVLEGLHAALTDTLDDLIAARNRAQYALTHNSPEPADALVNRGHRLLEVVR